jgi:hypothetical protein
MAKNLTPFCFQNRGLMDAPLAKESHVLLGQLPLQGKVTIVWLPYQGSCGIHGQLHCQGVPP